MENAHPTLTMNTDNNPSLIGQRVSFKRDGEELSGVVAIGEKNGMVMVRLDRPTHDGLPVKLVRVEELMVVSTLGNPTLEKEKSRVPNNTQTVLVPHQQTANAEDQLKEVNPATGNVLMTDEEIWRMIEEDFGLPEEVPTKRKMRRTEESDSEAKCIEQEQRSVSPITTPSTAASAEIDARIERMLVEDFGLPKVVPKNHRSKIDNPVINPDGSRMTPEQIQERIDRLIIQHFGIPQEIVRSATGRNARMTQLAASSDSHSPELTCEEFDERIKKMLVLDFGPKKAVTASPLPVDWTPKEKVAAAKNDKRRRAFTPQGNLTGAPLFEGQEIDVVSAGMAITGDVDCLLMDGDAFVLWQQGGAEEHFFFFVDKVTITNPATPR